MRNYFASGFTLPDGTFVVTFERWRGDVDRHLVGHCTCSHCRPHRSSDWKELPPPGRFAVEVPPKDNKWKWTWFSLRWGKWRYEWTLRGWQLFPSVWPFFKKERW